MGSIEREHFSLRKTLGKSIIVGTFVGRPDLAARAALLGYGLGGVGYIGKKGWRPFLDRLHRNSTGG